MSFVKALVPGALLTWVVCIILGTNRSKGGFLYIHLERVGDVSFYWSWPLFFASTLIAFAIFKMME